MEHILVKVYGSVQPADIDMCARVSEAAQSMGSICGIDECISLEGTLLTVHFEGVFFPIDDVLTALKSTLSPQAEGRLDYIDMDEWTLTRFWIQGGLITHNTTSLNQVMEYSGH